MEAIIKGDNQKTFLAIAHFLQTLNFEVIIKQRNEKSIRKKNRYNKHKSSSLPTKNILHKLVNMYNSGVATGSVIHDKEIYCE